MGHKLKQKKVKSFDGTVIGYQTAGRGKKTIILCNGLGGSVVAWKPFYEAFGDSCRFVSWDYRGLFHSAVPKDKERLTVADHAMDLSAIVKKEGIKRALVAGWSMGVQVCLEYYFKNPKIFAGMFLLNGTCGNPFQTALNNPLSKYILPQVNELAHRIVPMVQGRLAPIANRLIDWKGFITLVARLGLVHKNLNPEIFQEVAHEMVSADLKIYHRIMRHLSRHSACLLLSRVRVPVLIVAGDEDILTPKSVAEKMAESIPGAELFIVPHGTHYSLLEFPDMINLRVGKFLGEHYRY